MVWPSIFNQWWFWAMIGVIALTGVIKSTPLKKFPIFNDKKLLIWIAIAGLVITSGMLGSFSLGSLVKSSVTSGVVISQLQTTTAYTFDGAGYADDVADSSVNTKVNSIFYINETHITGDGNIENGVFMVTRSGDLKASACTVSVSKPERYTISDTTYHIVNEDVNTGIMTAYVHTGASSAVATQADPKESNQLAFAEGVAVGYVALNISLDETGFDPLTIYNTKDINVDICGYPFVFQVVKADV